MSKERLSMRKLMEILRLRIGEKRSLRETSTSVSCSPSKVYDVVVRFEATGLAWPLDESIDETTLERLMYDSQVKYGVQKVKPDLTYLHHEMRRKGVTLQLLWQEYKELHPEDGYQHSRFCTMYRDFEKKLSPGMRHTHKAGEKGFVDWSGDGIEITNGDTGEVWEASLFVGVLGASGKAFITAKADRKSRHWIACHCEMYEDWGGVPALTIPDNEKTGVTNACLYEPDLNTTYYHMARHYGTTVLPTRPRKPKDKALVENAVLNAQRWILAALRNHTFFNVSQANEAIREKQIDYNNRKMQLVDVSREELFVQLDKPALKPLPTNRYEYAEWSEPKVHIDYHILVDKHYYSVPYQYIGERVSASRTRSIVEVFFIGKRIAVHRRLYQSKEPSTLKEHMPSHHKAYSEWSPDRFIRWAEKTGPFARQVIENNLGARRHPEQAYKTCLGILRLGKRYDDKRLESACQRALYIRSISFRSINTILEKGLDKKPLPGIETAPCITMPIHDNIRGPEDYH
jgi:transposase